MADGGRSHYQEVDPVTVKVAMPAVSVTVTANEWFTFARMAIRQEHRAREARSHGDAVDDFAPWMGLESDEAKLGLIAARAAVYHLQLILGDLIEVENVHKIRASQITTDLPGDTESWQQQFGDLAVSRGSLLHEQPEPSLVQHPHYPTMVSSQDAAYELGSLSAAVDLLLDVLTRVVESPTSEVESWSNVEGRTESVTRLKAFRNDPLTTI